MKYNLIIVYFFLLFFTRHMIAQDTIIYKGMLRYYGGKVGMLYDRFELYPNHTFKWTSEYDMKYSQYGMYEIKKID